jgi:hypothetical protein
LVPGHEGIAGNETADLLARTGSEHPFTGPEPACCISIGVPKTGQGLDEQKSCKTSGIHNWTQTGKGTYIMTLCQKNKGSVEIKQRQIKRDSKLFTGRCNLKGHLFKLGLADDPTCERCLEKDESATHVLWSYVIVRLQLI